MYIKLASTGLRGCVHAQVGFQLCSGSGDCFTNCMFKTQHMLTMKGLLDMPGPAMGCPKGVMEGLF